jgi:hypothetical protein
MGPGVAPPLKSPEDRIAKNKYQNPQSKWQKQEPIGRIVFVKAQPNSRLARSP